MGEHEFICLTLRAFQYTPKPLVLRRKQAKRLIGRLGLKSGNYAEKRISKHSVIYIYSIIYNAVYGHIIYANLIILLAVYIHLSRA